MQYRCPKCDGNIRTIGTKKGTLVKCRHCGTVSRTTMDNPTQDEIIGDKENERR